MPVVLVSHPEQGLTFADVQPGEQLPALASDRSFPQARMDEIESEACGFASALLRWCGSTPPPAARLFSQEEPD